MSGSARSSPAPVVIVGGGVIGLAIAWRLAGRGLGSIVVESGPLVGAASRVAAGILSPQEEADDDGPLLALSVASLARWPAFVDELARAARVEIGYSRRGVLAVAQGPLGERALARRAAWQRAAGLAIEAIDGARVPSLEPALSTRSPALRFAHEGSVEPERLHDALARAALQAGVSRRTAAARRLATLDGRVVGVELADGSVIEADRVVVAAGSWSSRVEGLGLAADAVFPVRGQLVELRARPGTLSHVVFVQAEGAQPGGYLVPRDDGRVVVGSTMERAGFDARVTASGLSRLLALAERTVPALADAEVVRVSSGLRPATADGLPILGLWPRAAGGTDGLVLATGHLRNGILLAPLTADVVCACLQGEPPPVELSPFAPARLAPPRSP